MATQIPEGWERFEGLQLDQVRDAFVRRSMVSDHGEHSLEDRQELAASVEIAYKQFLYLCAKYNEEKLVPTGLIDKFWHEHILSTRKYQQDCENLFGGMLHHEPALPSQEPSLEQIIRTKDLFDREFGPSADPRFRPENPGPEGGCARDCNSHCEVSCRVRPH